ncbi:hypothetical protein IQ06DRAFT_338954 [Phaeosphaeriaceae sp. SRC1lsM3a]|nr:hypothetical protein IQ06DRAFT_338954 [Stagonospora sp. SRC1lsM3a]
MSEPADSKTQTRGLIIVIVLSILATVGMFCLIITLVICKNKRDRRKREARLNSSDPTAYIGGAGMLGGEAGIRGVVGVGSTGKRGRYQKLEDEEAGGVWSVEMDERRDGNGAYEMAGGAGGNGVGGRYEMTRPEAGGMRAGWEGDKETYQ